MFFGLFEEDDNDYDFKRLRKDIEDEYTIQSATFSGGFGFCQMIDTSSASDEQLIKMAKKEGFNLNKYRRWIFDISQKIFWFAKANLI